MLKKSFLALFFLLIASGPALAVLRPQISPDIKTVAIISSLPDRMNYDAVGVSVFGNGHEAVDLTDWHLNEFALEKARYALRGHFDVKAPHLNVSENPTASAWAAAISAEPSRADLYIIIEVVPPYTRMGVDLGGIYLQKHFSAIRTEPPMLGFGYSLLL